MTRAKSNARRRPRSNPRGVLSVNQAGYGFVQTAEGEYFVPEAKMNGAFDGDLVEVAALPKNTGARKAADHGRHAGQASEKPAARVLHVIDRAHDSLVGRYEVAEPFGVVVPEDPRIPYDIFTMRTDNPTIPDGSLVRVRITTFPSRHTAATGIIEEVIGQADDEDIAIDLLIAHHKLETAFSAGSLAQAAQAQLDETEALAAGYRDERDRFVFTIDPVDARDFDDALSIERLDKSFSRPSGRGAGSSGEEGAGHPVWRLGVHIADVSHYVPWNSSIDLDARRRATSVYLVDRVLPMLPEELSCDLCSLKPNETRRSMSIDLYLDDRGRLACYEAYPALICSKARLSYEQAQRYLEGRDVDGFDAVCAAEIAGRLTTLSQIARLRVAKREAAGGLDFATVEAKARLDVAGRPTAIDIRQKTDATSLVEEAMILANETVARHMEAARFPCLYRVHERPSSDNLAGLVAVFQEFSWFKDIDAQAFVDGNPFALQQVLEKSKGRSEGELVSTLLLRSMKRAVYKPACEGHYGLASSAYTHFTSPIRRYPDLVVHRMLRSLLTKRPEKFDQEVVALPWIAEHSSDCERIAEQAARESQELKIIEYLERDVGRTFSAVVSGVAAYGVYVRLDNTAEGLVRLKDLGREYFAFDPVLYRLVGADTGKTYRLGQRFAVVLTEADVRLRRLDFRLAREQEDLTEARRYE